MSTNKQKTDQFISMSMSFQGGTPQNLFIHWDSSEVRAFVGLYIFKCQPHWHCRIQFHIVADFQHVFAASYRNHLCEFRCFQCAKPVTFCTMAWPDPSAQSNSESWDICLWTFSKEQKWVPSSHERVPKSLMPIHFEQSYWRKLRRRIVSKFLESISSLIDWIVRSSQRPLSYSVICCAKPLSRSWLHR